MENVFEIRKVSQSDITALAALYEQVWPNVSFDKLEKVNFVLKESTGVSYCAIKEGEIVGSRTSFFMPAYYGERKLNCVQFADSCVRKDCRRQGLFLKMNQAFLDGFFKEQPGELIYNISVDASRSAYEKLGWNYIKSLHGITKYPHFLRLLFKIGFDIRKLKGAPKFDSKTEVQPLPVSLFDVRDEFFSLTKTIHIKYSAEIFNWRIKSGNGIKVFLEDSLGAVVYKIGKKPSGISYLSIGEVFLAEYKYNNFKKLIDILVNKLNVDSIGATITLGHPLLPFYNKYGLKVINRVSAYLNHGVRVETEEMKEICYNPNNWALSMLDIDTF